MKEIVKYSKKYGHNRTFISKNCAECGNEMEVLKSEVKRGSGKVCSRSCYYPHMKKVRPSGSNSWAWKGDRVGKEALHNWVQKHRGKPKKCEHCGTTKASKYEWANKSQKYLRDLKDWLRLCTKCHAIYDKKYRVKKWRETVSKRHGWKVAK